MEKTLTNQVIALAGLAQAVALVQQVAKRGSPESGPMEASIGSLLMVDADDIDSVYGGLQGLKLGLKALVRQLSEPRLIDRELARYASTLVFLEPRLMADQAMVETITAAITAATALRMNDDLALDDQALIGLLAEAYQKTLSQMTPRVMVSGEERFLSQKRNADQIRALLLAGIRSALLWRQAGGARWRLLFARGFMRSEAERLYKRVS